MTQIYYKHTSNKTRKNHIKTATEATKKGVKAGLKASKWGLSTIIKGCQRSRIVLILVLAVIGCGLVWYGCVTLLNPGTFWIGPLNTGIVNPFTGFVPGLVSILLGSLILIMNVSLVYISLLVPFRIKK